MLLSYAQAGLSITLDNDKKGFILSYAQAGLSLTLEWGKSAINSTVLDAKFARTQRRARDFFGSERINDATKTSAFNLISATMLADV